MRRFTFYFVLYLFVVLTLSLVLSRNDVAINLIKDAFRDVRSEVHLAQYFLRQYIHKSEVTKKSPLKIITPLLGEDIIYISHASGEVNGEWKKNSLEGLASSIAKGCKYIEMDFDWTTDKYLVSIHGWEDFFGDHIQGVMNLNTFKRSKRSDGGTQMTFDEVDTWLRVHPDVRLVTDVKSGNTEALRLFRVARSFSQIVPQTYSFSEYSLAKEMGFGQIILTTYLTYYNNSTLRRFAEDAHPSAITVPTIRLNEQLIKSISETGIPILTHPVYDKTDFDRLPKGVNGVYSSFMCGKIH